MSNALSETPALCLSLRLALSTQGLIGHSGQPCQEATALLLVGWGKLQLREVT